MVFNDRQEEKTVAAPPSEEELNPYSIFPQPEENFKVLWRHELYEMPSYSSYYGKLKWNNLDCPYFGDLGPYRNIFQWWKYMESTQHKEYFRETS